MLRYADVTVEFCEVRSHIISVIMPRMAISKQHSNVQVQMCGLQIL